MRIRLKEPHPRWGRAPLWFGALFTWFGLNLVIAKMIGDWLLGLSEGALWAIVAINVPLALLIDVFHVERKDAEPRLNLAQGEQTNHKNSAVRFHSIERP